MESCTSYLTLSISKAVCLCILWSARAQYIERASQCGAYAICVFVTTPRPSGCTTIKWRGAAFQWTPSSGSFCCFVYFNLHTKKEQKTRVGGLFVGWVSLGYKKKKKNKKQKTKHTQPIQGSVGFCLWNLPERFVYWHFLRPEAVRCRLHVHVACHYKPLPKGITFQNS